MTSRLVVNSVRHTGASADALTLDSGGGVTIPTKKLICPGTIVQVVQTVITDVKSYTANANTYADMPGFNCTITPSSSSNNVMIVVGIGGCHQSQGGTISGQVLRGSTVIGVGDAEGSRPQSGFRMYGAAIYNTNHCGSYHYTFLDTGISTTSATTYKLQTNGEAGTSYPVYLNRGAQDSDNNYTYRSRTISTMTLYEVAA